MSKEVSVNYNPGWLGLLGVIFVLAKVFEYGPIATWSWWLVLLPFYLGIAIILGILLVGAISVGGFFGVATLLEKWERRKNRIEREKINAKLSSKFQKYGE